jgi:hypothetical protein
MDEAKTKGSAKPIQQHILTGFRIFEISDKPVAAVAFQTKAGGRHRFMANRQMLGQLAQALTEHVKKMPAGNAEAQGSETPSKKDPQDWFDA